MPDHTDWSRYDPHRRPDRPVRVLVNLERLWPPSRFRWGLDTPPWARARGIRLRDPAPGVLSDWYLTEAGDWLGLVRFTIQVDGAGLEVGPMLVPAACVVEVDERLPGPNRVPPRAFDGESDLGPEQAPS